MTTSETVDDRPRFNAQRGSGYPSELGRSRRNIEVTMEALRRTNPVSDCPLTAALAAAGGKWKLIIIYWLADRPRHFAALRAEMPSISRKVLSEQLKELAADRIVVREETGPVPAPVIYSLTDYGRSLLPIVEAVRQWGRGHIELSLD